MIWSKVYTGRDSSRNRVVKKGSGVSRVVVSKAG